MDLISFNKHWEKDFYYNFKIKRIYYNTLKNNLSNKFILLLIGLRRVGKTTLMFQLINYLIENWIESDNILYYSFDNWWEIDDVVKSYLKIANKNLINDKLFFFFDEIQNVKNWQNKIKIYYDLYPNVKIILSGSSSLFLNSTESLAWRIDIYTVKPLYFVEFLRYKNLDYYLEKPNLYKEKLILEFEKYLYRQFFDTIDLNLLEVKKYMNSLKNKIIKEDAKKFFDIKYPDLLLRLFDIFTQNPGMILDYKHLANDLNYDARTIQTYVYYLQESFLINKVYNFSKNLLTSEKKQKKIYLNSCSFFTGNWEITWELFENYIQNYFDFKFFYRYVKKEVDFVYVNEDKIFAIEVKYKSNIKNKDFKWFDYFCKKFPVEKKIIISKDINAQLNDIVLVPFWEISNLFFNKEKC